MWYSCDRGARNNKKQRWIRSKRRHLVPRNNPVRDAQLLPSVLLGGLIWALWLDMFSTRLIRIQSIPKGSVCRVKGPHLQVTGEGSNEAYNDWRGAKSSVDEWFGKADTAKEREKVWHKLHFLELGVPICVNTGILIMIIYDDVNYISKEGNVGDLGGHK